MSFLRNSSTFTRTTAKVLAAGVGIHFTNQILNRLIVPTNEEDTDTETRQLPHDRTNTTNTDILGYPHFQFLKQDHPFYPHGQPQLPLHEHYIGPSWSMLLPSWIDYLFFQDADSQSSVMETHTVDILDARQRSLDFHRTGFTLLHLPPKEHQQQHEQQQQQQHSEEEINWRSNNEDIQQHFLQPPLEPHLLQLYPGATRIHFTHAVVRGGQHWTDQPVTQDGPHLDFSQNDALRYGFHHQESYPPQSEEQKALTEQLDTDTEEVRVLVGIWKPIHMGKNAVIDDRPLAVMDASTFQAPHDVPYHLHINLGGFVVHNMNGAIVHDPRQRWYYYAHQRSDEVLVFTQYTKGRFWANPHTSFLVPNRPEKYTPRQSIEIRAAVFYPKEETRPKAQSG